MKVNIISDQGKPIIRLEPESEEEQVALKEEGFSIGSLFSVLSKQSRGVILLERMFSSDYTKE